ncbi:TPA: HigA family addiction module antidote protein [Pseudomonas aeruginosa]|uniref:HigA family addiction module antitoxin n=1 Tax=Pseudomonas aeruginosa TaxID=287 RepID=UPI00097E7102|nr:HigA family addiction module antitoxin [Pseudomonas aeruginosa]ONN11859.1 addiction module antidote protein, HigA family [Pseudomonas aeruginosa]TEC17189.1 addiction module antidote protein, HigA family [Pseudomonas aeruginosa]HBP0650771.1 HigA family addiction module antidote protein [Pseudomonas aeruginosa]
MLRDDVLPALGLTVSVLAKHLHYSESDLSAVLHGRSAINAELAVCLELAGVGSARHWLAQQLAYDLWQAQQRKRPAISRLDVM